MGKIPSEVMFWAVDVIQRCLESSLEKVSTDFILGIHVFFLPFTGKDEKYRQKKSEGRIMRVIQKEK